MTTVVFFLEEPSAKAMLEGLLPRLLPPQIAVRYVPFEGKQDLHRQLERKLRGWLAPATRFIVLRDQDSGDCVKAKQELSVLCQRAGRPETLIRVACRELESFYLGDLRAVEAGLGVRGLTNQQPSRKFRAPDRLNNAKDELRRVTHGRYQEIAGSRAIGPHLSLDQSNRSHSFGVFISGIQRVARELLAGQ